MDVAKFLLRRAPIHPIVDPREAKNMYRNFRITRGWADNAGARLLTLPDENTKFAKTQTKSGTVLVGLSLAPARQSGHNVCASSTRECRKHCVAFSGHGTEPRVQKGRRTKTEFLIEHPEAFVSLLHHELALTMARYREYPLRARLNAFSDLPWEAIAPALFDLPIMFYDYTKRADRIHADLPANYRLTFSASERTTDDEIVTIVNSGVNVAAIFPITPSNPLPETYLGVPVIDADKDDDRFSDPVGVIVGLRAKGTLRKDPGRFVREIPVVLT